MQLNPLALALSTAGGSRFNPTRLFLDASQGFWLDASDRSTLFQDSAGTTPVTALGDPVGRWLDKSGRGNHFVQTDSGARPVWGSWPLSAAIAGRVRNLFSSTEVFSDAYWSKTDVTVTANAATAPDGTLTADKLVETATTAGHRLTSPTFTASAGATYTATVYAEKGERDFIYFRTNLRGSDQNAAWFNLNTGAVGTTLANFVATITLDREGFYRCSVTFAQSGITTTRYAGFGVSTADNEFSYAGDGTSGAFIWGAQLEIAPAPTAYQRVGVSSRYDVSEAGQPQYFFVSPDGIDDFMVSAANVNFSATSSVAIFEGVTSLNADNTAGVTLELGNAADVSRRTGSFSSFAEWSSVGTYTLSQHRGATANVDTSTTNPAYAPPITFVKTTQGALPNPIAMRINGANVSSSATTAGAGPYRSDLMYICARNGTTFFMVGNIYQLICVGKTPTISELNQTETFVAAKTKGSLA